MLEATAMIQMIQWSMFRFGLRKVLEMVLLQIVFWLAFCLLAWTYIGYPLTMLLLSRVFAKPWQKAQFSGSVSMIIAAHNEEHVIREKVENCLNLDFGSAEAEIIIVSDGSGDGTNAILEEFSAVGPPLRVITYQPRAGKANALNVGASQSRGQILVFSDANVMVGEKSCRALLAPFADPAVGGVCGRVLLQARASQEVAGESLYMKYEGLLQRAEALLQSTVGVDGALFALRRDLFRPLDPGIILDDLMLSMQALTGRLRFVYEKDALAAEDAVPSVENEFKRKARIVSGGYQFLAAFRRSGLSLSPGLWFAFFSHKILRWCAPFPLLLLFFSNIGLLGVVGYRWLFGAQCAFYLLAALGVVRPGLRRNYLVYVPYFFAVINVAAFQGFFRFLASKQQVLWEKVERGEN
jgi:cellulose synthase/poly-beta-1,6-N-acetylglucosamine synthase-like glycosyltransferase